MGVVLCINGCWAPSWVGSTLPSLKNISKWEVQAKISYNMVGGMEDPYITISAASSEGTVDRQDWPNVLYPDIYNYTTAVCNLIGQLEYV